MMSNPELALNYHYPCDLDGPGAVCDPDNVLVREVFNRSMRSVVERQSYRPSIFARVLANEIQVIPTPSQLLDHISPISSPFFLVFCAFSPSRRGGSNEPKTGIQGQETVSRAPKRLAL